VTLRAVLSAIGRRWYFALATLLVTALAFALFARDGGTYTTKTVVTFLVPATSSLSPDNGSGDSSVIAFARSVAAAVNTGKNPISYSTDDAPYYGAGLRQGVLVVVPNDGNQWFQSFTRAEIDIEIVGRTQKWVKQQQTTYVDAILQAATDQQNLLVSQPGTHITASVVPLTLDIGKVAPTRSALAAAAGALLIGALLVAAWGSVALDRRLVRRRSARPVPGRRSSPLRLRDSMT